MPTEPLRRTHIMTGDEYLRAPGEDDDPLGEDHDTVVPGLVHRYPDRVLFLTTGTCSTYCRYCTALALVGNPGGEYQFSTRQWEQALAYLEAHTEVRDVLLSGGDPLTLGDDKLDWLLSRLRAIPHIEFLRIGTKMPVVLPQRITPDLVQMLKKHHPLWMSLHFTHPDELTPRGDGIDRAAGRCRHSAGQPDRAAEGHQRRRRGDEAADARPAEAPGEALLSLSVRSDPRLGAISAPRSTRGWRSSRRLRGHTTGYATPIFAIDAPGGGGKIQLAPDPVVGRDGDDLLLRNFEGKIYRYPDPGGTLGADKAAGWRPSRRSIACASGSPTTCAADYLALGYGEEETAEFDAEDHHRRDLRGAGRAWPSARAHRQRQAAGRARWRRASAGTRVFNICEGLKGVAREAQVPALLEAYDIPYVFSDPLTLGADARQGHDQAGGARCRRADGRFRGDRERGRHRAKSRCRFRCS